MGFITDTIGAVARGVGDQQVGQARQAVDLFNQQASDLSAADALSRGNEAAALARGQGTKMIGQQQVGYAASGVDTASGSPLDVMASTRMMSELDAQKLRNNATREALGYRIKSFQFGLQSAIDKTATSNAAIADGIGGGAKVAGDFAGGSNFLGG